MSCLVRQLPAAVIVGLLWGAVVVEVAMAQPPAALAEIGSVPTPGLEVGPQRPSLPPRNSGPAAMSHSRYRRGRHGTVRVIRRTPEVMREDAARVKRGDLFSTWSNEYLK
jgi:hypothetical protein